MSRTKKPFRVAMIGCGGISRAHAQGFRQLSDLFTVRAACDVNVEAANKCAADLPSARVTTDWQEVLGDPEIDAVDILLPHDLHHPVAVAAAEAGKHILLEKPLATTVREGKGIVKAVERAGVACMVAFNERHRWPVRTIKEIVETGRIGEVYLIRTDHNQNPKFAPKQWYRSKAKSGGGALIGSGIHMLDLLHWFGGEVRYVSAVTRHIPGRVDEEAAACVVVQFADDRIGSLDISWAAPRHPWYQFLVVYGTKGTATTLGGDVTISSEAGVETVKTPVQDSYADSFVKEIEYFGECLAGGKQPMTHPADALRSLEICMAAYRSAETHKMVRLPFKE